MTVLSLGIDLGTSGIRSAVVDEHGAVISTARASYAPQNPDSIDANSWWNGVVECLTQQIATLRTAELDPADIRHIAVDGTSGTMVLTDLDLVPVTRALMYNSDGFTREAERIAAHAPNPHITRGTGSALGRMMRLQSEDTDNRATHMLHQADFITAKLIGCGRFSDHNNSLKSGFDPVTNRWPDWAADVGVRTELLPQVKPAGAALSSISPHWAAQFDLSPDTMIHAGTTDSIAAFLACTPLKSGAAVTSLGTTLAIKLLSPVRIDAPELGLYSHRLGDQWLVGGASNTGGGVLLHFFTTAQIVELSKQIDPNQPSELNYYPLIKPGERFPINDPSLAPQLSPRPNCDVAFLHGLLESMARIEATCYEAIEKLGAPKPHIIFTAGGGAASQVWTAIRKRVIGINIQTPALTEASVGVALLSRI